MITFIVASHDEEVFNKNIGNTFYYKIFPNKFIIQKGYTNIRKAFNDALIENKISSKYLAFIHHDVWFNEDFADKLNGVFNRLEEMDPNFGVLGFAGVNWKKNNFKKEYVCSVNDRGNIYGYRADDNDEIVEVETVDELCLITKNEDWVRFDQESPNRHLYGAELCLKANSLTKKNYIIPIRIDHNGKFYGYLEMIYLNKELIEAADHLKKEHREYFPFSTTCMEFT